MIVPSLEISSCLGVRVRARDRTSRSARQISCQSKRVVSAGHLTSFTSPSSNASLGRGLSQGSGGGNECMCRAFRSAGGGVSLGTFVEPLPSGIMIPPYRSKIITRDEKMHLSFSVCVKINLRIYV